MDLYNVPIVSIACITYNQENYIKYAIEGFLMQKTTFPIEIIINDDSSTDNTANIIRDYVDKYPNLIIPIFQKENQFSQGINPGVEFVFPKCTGKYIAICEGDDYWTDPYKLQKQVDFLETNVDFAICSHRMQTLYEGDDNEPDLSVQNVQKDISTIEDLAQGVIHIYTASCVFRNGLIEKFPDWFYQTPAGDYSLHMLNAQYGKIKSLPDIMGVYRVHRAGLWSNNDTVNKNEMAAKVIYLMLNHFAAPVNTILLKRYRYQCVDLIRCFKNNEEKCKYYSLRLIETNPFFINEILDEYNQTLKEILDSRSYKLGRRIVKPFRYLKKILFKPRLFKDYSKTI
jgi:glycosyltransferase involved in cell wall biosynthesis